MKKEKMQIDDLIQYLEDVTQQEQTIFELQSLLNNIENERRNVQEEKYYIPPKPIEPIKRDVMKPVKPKSDSYKNNTTYVWSFIVSVIEGFGCVFVFLFILFALSNLKLDISDAAFYLMWLVVSAFIFFSKVESVKEKNQKESDRLKSDLDMYSIQMDKYNEYQNEYNSSIYPAYINEVNKWNDIITKEPIWQEAKAHRIGYLNALISTISESLNEAKSVLDNMYSCDIIYGRYRNIIACSSFIDYFKSGICNSLGGNDGAYNKYDLESRLDKIIDNLDKIIVRINDIKNNQYRLWTQMKEATDNISRLSVSISHRLDSISSDVLNVMSINNEKQLKAINEIGSNVSNLNNTYSKQNDYLKDIKKTTELSSYLNEKTQKELKYMNRMNYLSGKYDDVFFNQPPN